MFNPKTEKIRILSEKFKSVISDLEDIFNKQTNVYIDLANVLGWQDKLGWHIGLKRLKQLFDSFDNVKEVKLYYGTLRGDRVSNDILKGAKKCHYEIRTKPVKVMKLSIDTSSISSDSPALLESFIKRSLLTKFSLENIEYLNKILKDLNLQGQLYIEDRKCNFDVEIGRDMLRDYDNKEVENFCLWSGDSDFEGPVSQLLRDTKRVVIFSTTRRVSTELSRTGARIFDIKKIKEFICWTKELPDEIKEYIESQKDSERSP